MLCWGVFGSHTLSDRKKETHLLHHSWLSHLQRELKGEGGWGDHNEKEYVRRWGWKKKKRGGKGKCGGRRERRRTEWRHGHRGGRNRDRWRLKRGSEREMVGEGGKKDQHCPHLAFPASTRIRTCRSALVWTARLVNRRDPAVYTQICAHWPVWSRFIWTVSCGVCMFVPHYLCCSKSLVEGWFKYNVRTRLESWACGQWMCSGTLSYVVLVWAMWV